MSRLLSVRAVSWIGLLPKYATFTVHDIYRERQERFFFQPYACVCPSLALRRKSNQAMTSARTSPTSAVTFDLDPCVVPLRIIETSEGKADTKTYDCIVEHTKKPALPGGTSRGCARSATYESAWYALGITTLPVFHTLPIGLVSRATPINGMISYRI